MANPYKKKSALANIGGEMSSPTPVTAAMAMKNLQTPENTAQTGNVVQQQYGGGMVKKYAKGGGTRPVRR